jgi:uncharacterized protein (DUF1501 family)
MKLENESENDGCNENRLLLSRRNFFVASAALFTSALLPSSSLASGAPGDARLLVVILRGGLDGLSTIVPYGDPNYEAHRGELVVNRDRIAIISPFFGLHPALMNLTSMYRAGHAAFIPAAGLPVRSRSHFECQANLENGLPNNSSDSSGWINRLLMEMPSAAGTGGVGALAVGPVPQILSGPAPIQAWSPNWFGDPVPQVVAALDRMYRSTNPALAEELQRGMELRQVTRRSGGDIDLSWNSVKVGFTGAARLLRADTGPRLAVLSVSGWDTHNAQGNLQGQLNNRLAELDEGLGTFRSEITDQVWERTVIVCATEFGRSVRTNGTSGTDHGVGMPVILAGGAVNGGIHGDWPGLRTQDLFEQRDLRPTVDLRSVFKGILRDHLSVPSRVLETAVFPNSAQAAPPLGGLIRRRNTSASGATAMEAIGVGLTQQRPEIRDFRAYRAVHGRS